MTIHHLVRVTLYGTLSMVLGACGTIGHNEQFRLVETQPET